MSKNYLVIGVIVLVLLGGGYFLMKGYSSPSQPTDNTNNIAPTEVSKQLAPSQTTSTETTATSNQNSKKVMVEYTDKGFVPKTITVKAGTTVTWVNKDNDPVWVASAPHPAHTDLPGFDALKGYKTGESYSYTFTKAGNWKYHNHLEASNYGAVVVEK